MTNSRNKGASFEREIGNLLTADLGLKNNVRRILEQTREKHLPDLMLGRWYIECKRYGTGAEPLEAWWQQVLDATREEGIPAKTVSGSGLLDRKDIKTVISELANSSNPLVQEIGDLKEVGLDEELQRHAASEVEHVGVHTQALNIGPTKLQHEAVRLGVHRGIHQLRVCDEG